MMWIPAEFSSRRHHNFHPEPSGRLCQINVVAGSSNVRFSPKSVIEAGFAIARKRTSGELGAKSRLWQYGTGVEARYHG